MKNADCFTVIWHVQFKIILRMLVAQSSCQHKETKAKSDALDELTIYEILFRFTDLLVAFIARRDPQIVCLFS